MFRVFDEDNSGTLNFFEWYQASNVKNMTSIEEKLTWIFTAFDADGGGSIDQEEITEIVRWMFRFAGIEEDPDLLASCIFDVRLFEPNIRVLQLTFNFTINYVSRSTIDEDNDGDDRHRDHDGEQI